MLSLVIKDLDARPYAYPIACTGEVQLAQAHAQSLLAAGFSEDKAFFEGETITVYRPPLKGVVEWVALHIRANNFLHSREQFLNAVLSHLTGHHGLTDALEWTEVDRARFSTFVEALVASRVISKDEGAAALLLDLRV